MNQTSIDKPRPMGLVLTILIIIAILSIMFAVGLGPVKVSPGTTLKILASKLPVIGKGISVTWEAVDETIVLSLRLPRVLLGMVVGASLAVIGVAMQALIRNELADPFVLGVSSGAAATATLSMVFGAFAFLGAYALPLSAFIGAAATILIVYALSRVRGKVNITHLLLSGVAVSMMMDGLTRIITLSAPNALGLHNATFWMSGSLASAKWSYLTLPTAILLLGITLLMLNHRSLNLLLLGDESAGALGINVTRTQHMLILVSSLMAGVTISVSGTIGFVGLMIPHFARMLVGADHKRVLPLSALLGGILVVWVDVAARLLIAPEELPVGILTAVIGGPVFIWLLKKGGKEKS